MICNDDFYDFIEAHLDDDPAMLLMKFKSKELSFDLEKAITQIECRKKAVKKLPSFIRNPKFYFPTALSFEQASDERVAAYHASLLGTGKSVIDMTSGLGIDAMSIALAGNYVTAFELDDVKCDALRDNSKSLGIDPFVVVNADSVDYIRQLKAFPDYIFIDPARRDNLNRRTYSFADCLPNIMLFYKDVIQSGCRMFVKASPLLDITDILNQIPEVETIHIVCVKGECKEVFLDISSDSIEKKIVVVDLCDKGIVSKFEIKVDEIGNFDTPIATNVLLTPNNYLYEPNAGMMKLQVGRKLCHQFPGLKKASVNTSLFLSEECYPDFPGRILKITDIIGKKDFKRLKGARFNVAVRNYPLKAEDLRKKLQVKSGDKDFIYGFRFGDKAEVVHLTTCLI